MNVKILLIIGVIALAIALYYGIIPTARIIPWDCKEVEPSKFEPITECGIYGGPHPFTCPYDWCVVDKWALPNMADCEYWRNEGTRAGGITFVAEIPKGETINLYAPREGETGDVHVFMMLRYICLRECWDGSWRYTDEECPTNPINPPIPNPPDFLSILSGIIEWLRSIFNWLLPGTITGGGTFEPGETAIFDIDLSAAIDNDYSDGLYQVQYGGWMIIDESDSIVEKSDWTRVYGNYNAVVTTTVPTTTGNYVMVGVIYNYDMEYSGGTWNTIGEGIATKEAVEFTVGIPEPPPGDIPIPGLEIFTDILNSIKLWFCSNLGWFC